MKFEPGNNNGVKFGEGQDPTRGGRPKKLYNVLREMGYSKSDVRDATSELFWYTEAELKEVKADKKKPVIVRTIASVILKALAKGDFRYIKELVEQVLGKPQQKIDQKNTHVSNSVEIVSWLDKFSPKVDPVFVENLDKAN